MNGTNLHKTDKTPLKCVLTRAREAENTNSKKNRQHRQHRQHIVNSHQTALPNDPGNRYNSTWLRAPGVTPERPPVDNTHNPSTADTSENPYFDILTRLAQGVIRRQTALVQLLTIHERVPDGNWCRECLRRWPCRTAYTINLGLDAGDDQ